MEKTTKVKRKSAAELLKERRIDACHARILRDRDILSAMQEEQAALSHTDIIGLPVTHRSFGPGQVVAQTPSTITVRFGQETKGFIMPSAFLSGFLTTEDPEMNVRLAQYQDSCAQVKTARDDMAAASRSLTLLTGK